MTGPSSSPATVGIVALLAVLVVGGFIFLNRSGDGEADRVDQQSSQGATTPAAPGSGSSMDLPTIDPSDFPSGFPSELQSAFPTGLPTNFPTSAGQPNGGTGGGPKGGPSAAPTVMPTGLPSGLGTFPSDPAAQQSWFSDYLDQVMPQ